MPAVLKGKKMADLISIDAVMELFDWWEHEYDEIDSYIRNIRQDVLTLPTIEAEPRWIPVTEKLPETDGIYLITDASCGYEDVRESFYYHNDVDYDDPYWDYNNVTAWMPLPEPYRGVEE